ncbi:MAG: single-stranded-DNA-specific exonuclease RecJ [Microgenomates group bacterium]
MKINFFYEVKNEEKFTGKKLIDLLLENRHIKDKKEFLNPIHPLKISLLNFSPKIEIGKSLKITFKILKELKDSGKMIVIYTDYDADGITGGAIIWETLYLLGFKVMPYVPDRKTEGYGFTIAGIDNVIKKYNPALIISVDHGITKIKEVEYAYNKGIKVIITDHHLKSDKIPMAEAIFHIPSLSGSGVAYFFAKEIFNYFSQNKNFPLLKETIKVLEKNFSHDYLAIASIGTIADLVPLIGPSRAIVKYGLEIFNKVNRLGIKHILKEAGIEEKKITPYDIGFIIAPRINATGRLKTALDALRLLCTKKESRALYLASYMGKINRERQDLLEKAVDEARQRLEIKHQRPKIIILKSDFWHEGIIGLIASKITEEYYRPTIVLTKSDGYYKGSARSIPNFHMTNFLRSLKEFLIDVGGHEQAAGFTISEEKINDFIKSAQKRVDDWLKEDDLERKINADFKIPIAKINLDLVKTIDFLSPFGIGNPQPLFYSEGVISDAKLFGKKNEHLKVYISSEEKVKTENQNLELIGFKQGEIFSQLFRHQKIKVVYTLEIDHWGEREKVRGKILFFS